MTKRKVITDRMKWQSCIYWGGVVCAECGGHLVPADAIEWDHVRALVFEGPHEYENIHPMHADCHRQKTIRDVKALAKVKRLENKRNGKVGKPKRKIRSAGFSKVHRPLTRPRREASKS